MVANKNILMLPGDGIGPEVMGEVRRVMAWMEKAGVVSFEIEEDLIGGCSIDAHGEPLRTETIERAKQADAVLLGAVGGPKWDNVDFDIRPEAGLLAIRKELGLFANLRPAIVFDALADASSLKHEVVSGLDILIVRELTGGIYFGEPRGVEDMPGGGKRGFNTLLYTTPEVERIARVGFELALKRDKRLCSIDKANVLESTRMWREEVIRVAQDYPDVDLSHMLVDNATMQLVRAPKQFDVIVTTNLFGDILSDLCAGLVGGLGLAPGANIGEDRAVFEAVHGSAPDIAGKNIANPTALLLAGAMMLDYLHFSEAAERVRKAVRRVIGDGDILTPDLGGSATTTEYTQALIGHL